MKLKLLSLAIFCLAANAQAQTREISFSEGGHSGNGGDPNELAEFTGLNGEHLDSWFSVRGDLIHGLETDKFLELNLGTIDPLNFKLKTLNMLKTVKVEWDDTPIRVDGTNRPCENYTDKTEIKRIHCNQNEYAAAMKNYGSDTQYKMIAHEYFALAGFENNSYGISDYPLSSQIALNLHQFITKKWAIQNEGAGNCDVYVQGDIGNAAGALVSRGYKIGDANSLYTLSKDVTPVEYADSSARVDGIKPMGSDTTVSLHYKHQIIAQGRGKVSVGLFPPTLESESNQKALKKALRDLKGNLPKCVEVNQVHSN